MKNKIEKCIHYIGLTNILLFNNNDVVLDCGITIHSELTKTNGKDRVNINLPLDLYTILVSINKNGSTISKYTFSAYATENEIDDPINFINKWAVVSDISALTYEARPLSTIEENEIMALSTSLEQSKKINNTYTK